MEKLWYAIIMDRVDDDWGYGTFDEVEARTKMHEINHELEANGLDPECYIAVIDAGYDENGEPTKDALCVSEITE